MNVNQISKALLKNEPLWFYDTTKRSDDVYLKKVAQLNVFSSGKFNVESEDGDDEHNRENLKFISNKEYKESIAPVVYRNKKPTALVKYLGIEVEFISRINRYELALLLGKQKLSKYLTIDDDGSIDIEKESETDVEVKILVKESEYKEVVPRIMKILNKVGYVNDSCGLHVHIDMRSRKVEECYTKLVDSLEDLQDMVDENRIDKEYCKTNIYNDMKQQMTNCGGRYYAINPIAYSTHKTLEVRLKESTLSGPAVVNWIVNLLAVVNKPSKKKKVTV